MAADQINPRDAASALIASDRVEGTAVYGPNNHRIGRIERLMIDKLSGKVAYAVLSFVAFWGLGKTIIRSPGRSSSTTPSSTAIRSISPRTSLRPPPNSARTITGTGQVVTNRCTSITASIRSGTKPDGRSCGPRRVRHARWGTGGVRKHH